VAQQRITLHLAGRARCRVLVADELCGSGRVPCDLSARGSTAARPGVGHDVAMPEREPRVRRAPIPNDAVLVIRGDDLEPGTARVQAEAFRRRFAGWDRWGLSAYYARSEAEIDDLAADQLERFAELVVLPIRALEQAGFEIVPTFRTPHVTIAFGGDLAGRLTDLERLGTDRRANPYHGPEPAG
jgi:hypothetical protein